MNSKKKLTIIVSSAIALLVIAGFAANIIHSPFKADENQIIATTIKLPVNNERFVYMDKPLIQGKSTTGNVINIYDNDTLLGNAIADASGSFYYKTTTPFTKGTHKIEAKNSNNSSDISQIYISIDTSDPSKAILKAQNTQIIENDHPYYANGVNEYDSVVGVMDGSATIENNFAAAEKAGIKMIRIINYMLDDMALPNPVSAPATVVADGGSMTAGNYVYRYTCSNLSKTSFAYTAAETLASPATGSVTVGANQQVTLTLNACAKSYRYNIYRRLATDPLDSEKLVGNTSAAAGTVASFVDLGTATPTTAIPATNSTRNNPRSTWPTAQSKAFMTGFGNWNESSLMAADQTMVLAKKYGIRILFTFADQHDNNTGGVKEITRNCAVGNSAFFSATCPKDFYKQIIDKFTLRTNTISGVAYKDDPAIFGWEFLNEPYETGSGGTFRGWVNEMGDYLKTKDPNHMLSTGDDGSIWFTHNHEAAYNSNNNHDFVMMGTPDPIDLLTWHGYPESNGFMFNHGYYGEFTPDPVTNANWLSKYGPVNGPISIDKAIQQLQLHAHYATMLNKPVIFGEWGVDWKTTGPNWIADLSDAVLTAKPDLVRGENVYPDPNFVQDPIQYWPEKTPNWNLNIANDNTISYKDHSTLKLLPTATNITVTSKKFPIKPNSPYWYEYMLNNPTSKTVSIAVNAYYKNGVKLTAGAGTGVTYGQTSGWKTLTRYNSGGQCEFTTPDADEVDFYIRFNNGVAGDEAWLGQFGFYELVPPTDNANSTFAGTGWWAWPDATGLGNAANTEALKTAAVNFANASMAGLPSLYTPPVTPPVVTPPPPAPSQLNLSSSNFSNSWNMVSFPDLGSGVTDDSLIPNTFKIRRYDGASNSYKKGDDGNMSLTPGAGYWLKVDDTNRINGLKYPLNQTSSTEISTTKGWNLLGNPYQSDLPLSNLQVKYKDGSTRSYAEAIAKKEVSSYAWSWEASSKQYNFIAITPDKYKTASPKSTVIKPFRGFWMIVKSDQISGIILNK